MGVSGEMVPQRTTSARSTQEYLESVTLWRLRMDSDLRGRRRRKEGAASAGEGLVDVMAPVTARRLRTTFKHAARLRAHLAFMTTTIAGREVKVGDVRVPCNSNARLMQTRYQLALVRRWQHYIGDPG